MIGTLIYKNGKTELITNLIEYKYNDGNDRTSFIRKLDSGEEVGFTVKINEIETFKITK